MVIGCGPDPVNVQVCVYRNGKRVVDLWAGCQSPYDLRPVGPDSLFPCFSVTKGVAATAVHLLVERGLVELSAPVASYWPAFAAHGKQSITVEHVLSHRAGLSSACLDEMARDPYLVCDSDKMLHLLANAVPESAPGSETKDHYLTFGWLLDGIVRGAAGVSVATFVREHIALPLGIESELMVGLGPAGCADPAIRERLVTLVLHRAAASAAAAAVEKAGGGDPIDTSRFEHTPATDSEGVGDAGTRRRPASGPSMLLNPTFFNSPRIREV